MEAMKNIVLNLNSPPSLSFPLGFPVKGTNEVLGMGHLGH